MTALRIRLASVMFAVLACALACNSEPPAPAQMPPAPAPGALADPAQQAQPAPATPAATAVPAAPSEPAPAPAVHEPAAVKPVARVEEEKHEVEPSKPSAKLEAKESAKESAKIAAGEPEPKKSGAASTKPAEPTASAKSAPPAPAKEAPPPAPAPEPAKAATGKVTVPKTDHVHIDVPKGLQHWLDADTRMQPWVNKVVSVADACYERERKDNPKAAGVIPIKITMHENERPDADVGSVPSSLGAVIACGTTKLMGSRPPLFTGKEGESYTVKIHFDK